MSYYINSAAEAVQRFNEQLEETPASLQDGKILVDTIQDYAEHDYDCLNQEWANWLDMMVDTNQAPAEAREWDWEDEI
ncbi:hypothetical protein VH22019_00072 [Vibrio phage VH2_2019]|nr:hypothetical protein VH22019_00072 [Vibrio phage VH2_2019]